MVADAEAAAEIDAGVTAKPAPRNSRTSSATPLEGPAERREIDELRADMHRKPDRLDAGQRSGEAVGRDRVVDIDAELVLFLAGRDLGVGQRIDIGIDPDRDRRDPAARRRRSSLSRRSSGIDSTLIWWMPAASAASSSPRVLPTPEKMIRSRRDAGGERAAQLAFRDDVGAGAEPGEEAQHGEVRVRLDRVADQRPLGARTRRQSAR